MFEIKKKKKEKKEKNAFFDVFARFIGLRRGNVAFPA
jgi:predicted CopG family antitoxin